MVAVKTTSSKIANVAKDVLLAPLYLYQGRDVKRNTLRLPEPKGARYGRVKLNSTSEIVSDDKQQTLQVMIVGDSAAAGVGSPTQQQALIGKLIPALQQQPVIHTQFDDINWSLQATTGHTSFDILRRLYVLTNQSEPVDVMMLSVGVNDTTANVSAAKWQQQLEDIIIIAQRKFSVKVLIFSSLPPMAQMPALPAPLNSFIGAKATQLDKILQQVCAAHNDVHYMETSFERMAQEQARRLDDAPIDTAAMFADDGFHPSAITYGYWAQQLAELIAQLLDTSSTGSVIE